MYKIINQTIDGFKSGDKGIFLTNTRHSYKHIKNSKNELYWNTGTFFNQWHPGKSYSIRIHNVTLSVESQKETPSSVSTDGIERYSYKWIRMETGIWEKVFKENGNRPVAISLKDNIFGKAGYVGNHMINVAANQTLYDANDGLIFLAPLEDLHFSAKFAFIYTPLFKQELKRRIALLECDNLSSYLQKNKVESLDN